MPVPDFNADESYLIYSIKSPRSSAMLGSYMGGYLMGAAMVAGLGAYYGSVEVVLVAFAVICGFRIYEEILIARWLPIYRSIFEKYEAALEPPSEPAPPGNTE